MELNLNITPIQSEDNGRIVINGNEAAKVAMSLSEIEEEIKSKIASITRNLDLDTSFIGRGQSQAILNCFTDISNEIHRVFSYLTEGDNNLYDRINKVVEKYENIISQVNDSFKV